MTTPQNPLLAAYRAQQAANQQPVPPSVIMPPDSSPSVAPLLPPEPGPRIVAPRGTTPADSAEQSRLLSGGSGISQIHSKIENSGFGQKHPFLGKLAGWAAQIPAMAADIGVSSVAPQITTLTPGTEYHHRALLNQGSRLLAQDYANQQKESQAKEENAQAGEAEARADALENPVPKPAKPETWKTLLGGNGQLVTAPNGKIVQESSEGNLRVADLPEGATVAPKAASGNSAFDEWSRNPQKYEDFQKAMGDIKAQIAAEHPQQAKNASFMNVYAAQRFLQLAYSHNPAILPVASAMIAKMLNLTPEQAQAFATIPEDQPLSPETGHAIGTSMPEAPTAGTRNQAQTAARVLTEMPRIRAEVTNLAGDLGPARGRLMIGFLLGGVGSTGDPKVDRQLSELRTDLHMTPAAAARFHLNSVEAMKGFDALIQAGKSPAEAIQGTLDSIQKWAESAQHQERGYGETENAPGTIYARDPQGKLHKAPAGTPLPPGWKEEKH